MIAAIGFANFWTFIGGLVCLVTIAVGALGLVAQQRSRALIETMKTELDLSDRKRTEQAQTITEQGHKIEKLEGERESTRNEVRRLSELVTQAAKVDALTTTVNEGFAEVLRRLPAPL